MAKNRRFTVYTKLSKMIRMWPP